MNSYNKIPYFVYEPFENGKTNKMINSALVFNRESISRDINELETQLNNNSHSLLIDHKAMFEGIPISEIKLSSL